MLMPCRSRSRPWSPNRTTQRRAARERRRVRHQPVLIALLGLALSAMAGASPTLSGRWQTELACSSAGNLLEFASDLTITYGLGDWELEGEFGFGTDGWEKVQAEASGEIGQIEISSSIAWEPDKVRFKKWSSQVSAKLRDVKIDGSLDLYPDHCWADLRVRADLPACHFDVETRLGEQHGFGFDYYRTDIELSFSLHDVPIELTGRVTAKEGFEHVDVEANLPFPLLLSWLALRVDVRISASGTERSFEPTLVASMVCETAVTSLELLGEAISIDDIQLDRIGIVGIELSALWNEWWAESRWSLHPDWNKKLTGHKAFCRAIGTGCTIEGPNDRDVAIEIWSYDIATATRLAWTRMTLAIVCRPAASWELAFTAISEPTGLELLRIGIDVRF
jgi:hypothetical protein